MLLALDVGNTNITLGCYENDKLLFISRIATDTSRMEDQYAIEIRDILQIYGVNAAQAEGAIISSVVPPLTELLQRAIRKITGKEALVIGPGIKTGLNIRIDNPATLGADFVVGCVAAMESYPCPCIILDMGTATTFAVLDKSRSMIGGCILPGVRVSMDALSNRTSQLPHIALSNPPHVIGTNTVDCMLSGIVLGEASMVDGMCDRIEEELGAPCTVIATGGIAGSIVPYCKRKIILRENLLLDGLLLIYKKNIAR